MSTAFFAGFSGGFGAWHRAPQVLQVWTTGVEMLDLPSPTNSGWTNGATQAKASERGQSAFGTHQRLQLYQHLKVSFFLPAASNSPS